MLDALTIRNLEPRPREQDVRTSTRTGGRGRCEGRGLLYFLSGLRRGFPELKRGTRRTRGEGGLARGNG